MGYKHDKWKVGTEEKPGKLSYPPLYLPFFQSLEFFSPKKRKWEKTNHFEIYGDTKNYFITKIISNFKFISVRHHSILG